MIVPPAAITSIPAFCPAEVRLEADMTEAINAERPALLTARIPKPNDTEMYPRQIGIPCDIPLRKFFFILTAPAVLSYLTYLSSVG